MDYANELINSSTKSDKETKILEQIKKMKSFFFLQLTLTILMPLSGAILATEPYLIYLLSIVLIAIEIKLIEKHKLFIADMGLTEEYTLFYKLTSRLFTIHILSSLYFASDLVNENCSILTYAAISIFFICFTILPPLIMELKLMNDL